MLVTASPGYALRVGPDALDTVRFVRGLASARAALDAGAAATAFEQASAGLVLWRGPALADVADEAFAAAEIARLNDVRLSMVELRLTAMLALGQSEAAIADLEALCASHPLREGIWALLMTALYRTGRAPDALRRYRQVQALMAKELGLDPGPRLRLLELAILRHDEEVLGPSPGAAGHTAAEPAETALAGADGDTKTAAGDTKTDGGADAIGTAPTLPRTHAQAPASAMAAHTVPAQLPRDVAAFTGRTTQLRQLEEMLDRDGTGSAVTILLIAGPAGVGKTALGVHWAHRVRHRFGDGQLYVDLRSSASGPPLRPIEALARFLRALGVAAEHVPVEKDEAASLYRSLLAGRRMLVLLDNAHSPEQVRPLLPGDPGCVVLVTSRDAFAGLTARDGAHRLTLDVLNPEDAHTLLVRILGARRVSAEPDATAELARLCAYLPLALRIAAATLNVRSQHRIAGYVADLRADDRLAQLAVDGDEDTAVRTAFDISYADLPAPACRLFRLLGLAPGPDITTPAAAALSGTTAVEAGRLLDRLARAHLIDEHAPGRYAFHDLMRLYARDQCGAEDDEPTRRNAVDRLHGYYLSTVDEAVRLLYPHYLRLPLPDDGDRPVPTPFADQAEALAWLDAEHANLVATVRHAAEHGPRPTAWLLADALRGYLYQRVHAVDYLLIATAGLTAAEAEHDLRAQAAGQLNVASLHWRSCQNQPAIDCYARALDLARRTGWLHGESATLGNLANVFRLDGQMERAADHLAQALAINRRLGWLAGQAINLSNLCAVHCEMGRLEESVDAGAQALALHRELGSRGSEAIALGNLGEANHALGRLDLALDQLATAVALHRENGSRLNETDSLRCLAALHRDAGRLAAAFEVATAALDLAREVAFPRLEADVLNVMATIHHHHGDHQQALDHHSQALELARAAETCFPQAYALVGMATARRHLGHLDQAHIHAQHAITLTHDSGYRILEGQALTCLAAIALDQGRHHEAVRHAEQALSLHRETGCQLGQARTGVLLGRALQRTGRTAAALTHWHDALDLLTAIGVESTDEVQALIRAHGSDEAIQPGRP